MLSSSNTEPSYSLEPGAWALLFQVDDLLGLDYFEGMLALKYHLSERRALRFGAGGNANTGVGRDRLVGGLGLQALYLLYPQPNREVNFYLGTGPDARVDIHREQIGGAPETRRTYWSLGLSGRLGVEWFATESLSILREYGNSLGVRQQPRGTGP